MFLLSQMTKVKLVCALAWRENFAKGNNSVTDKKKEDAPTVQHPVKARCGYQPEKDLARK